MYTFNKEKHLHTFNGKELTGTSSVVSVIAKPLTWWASGLACEKLGWKNSKYVAKPECYSSAEKVFNDIKKMTLDEYIKLLDQAYKAHSVSLKDSAVKGTDRHTLCEDFLKNGVEHPDIMHYVEWHKKNVDKTFFSECHCYSETLYTGGIFDALVSINKQPVILDFKSSKEVYQTHLIQAAGYALQIEENGIFDTNGKRLTKVPKKPIEYICIIPLGAKDLEKSIRIEKADIWKSAFKSALNLYRIINNGFTKEVI